MNRYLKHLLHILLTKRFFSYDIQIQLSCEYLSQIRDLLAYYYHHTVLSVADPGFGGRGGGALIVINKGEARGWVREGGIPLPHLEENGNQEML